MKLSESVDVLQYKLFSFGINQNPNEHQSHPGKHEDVYNLLLCAIFLLLTLALAVEVKLVCQQNMSGTTGKNNETLTK